VRGKGANTVKAQQFVERRTSQQIGAAHERAVRVLLDKWGLRYVSKHRFQTTLGSVIELDFFLPGTDSRPPVVLECKDFAVEAKAPSDSRRRKTQEALWLLLQVRKYCPQTKGARLVLVTGPSRFKRDQEALLLSEIGEDFHIVSVSEAEVLKRLMTGDTSAVLIPAERT